MLLIGRARPGGIEVRGTPGLLNFTAFEAAAGTECCAWVVRPVQPPRSACLCSRHKLAPPAAAAGSKYHRPAEHTHAVKGRTLQALQLGAAAGEAAATPASGRRETAEGEPLLEEEHDDFCYVCGLGVRTSIKLYRSGRRCSSRRAGRLGGTLLEPCCCMGDVQTNQAL